MTLVQNLESFVHSLSLAFVSLSLVWWAITTRNQVVRLLSTTTALFGAGLLTFENAWLAWMVGAGAGVGLIYCLLHHHLGQYAALPKTNSRMQDLQERHDKVRDQIAAHHIDLDLALQTPALEDVSVPTTQALLQAQERADKARDAALAFPCSTHEQDYAKAVASLEKSFTAAVDHALRVGDGSIRARVRGLLRRWRIR
jgi:hypothetical protein